MVLLLPFFLKTVAPVLDCKSEEIIKKTSNMMDHSLFTHKGQIHVFQYSPEAIEYYN
uniref:Uncharacterized protein n=1 Tax=Amphimedon queenslandica TaxID=400682 RepID=A0A1X7TYS7_AMPQE